MSFTSDAWLVERVKICTYLVASADETARLHGFGKSLGIERQTQEEVHAATRKLCVLIHGGAHAPLREDRADPEADERRAIAKWLQGVANVMFSRGDLVQPMQRASLRAVAVVVQGYAGAIMSLQHYVQRGSLTLETGFVGLRDASGKRLHFAGN